MSAGMYSMGIDGGGTSLRVVVVDDDLNVVAQTHGEGVNPNQIGHHLASQRIRDAVTAVLRDSPGDVSACALGIAGAAASHSADWLKTVLTDLLPQAVIVPSSDLEIALTGAHGKPYGILLLAGTGSAALGIDPHRNQVLVGGWGYLIDDFGSGYWLGNQALQHTVQVLDGRRSQDALSDAVLQQIECADRSSVIRWLYQQESPAPSRIASLAALVLNTADNQADYQSEAARQILDAAADHLAAMVSALHQQLTVTPALTVRFAGGLLQQPNALSQRVVAKLGLDTFPAARYPPHIGAALLAKLHHQQDL